MWRNGRRARFRSVCPKGRGGSTPPIPTSSALGGLYPQNARVGEPPSSFPPWPSPGPHGAMVALSNQVRARCPGGQHCDFGPTRLASLAQDHPQARPRPVTRDGAGWPPATASPTAGCAPSYGLGHAPNWATLCGLRITGLPQCAPLVSRAPKRTSRRRRSFRCPRHQPHLGRTAGGAKRRPANSAAPT
jgi:hypothetical protein